MSIIFSDDENYKFLKLRLYRQAIVSPIFLIKYSEVIAISVFFIFILIIILTDSESFPESIYACPSVCPFPHVISRSSDKSQFSRCFDNVLMDFFPRTNAIKNGSYLSTFSTTPRAMPYRCKIKYCNF